MRLIDAEALKMGKFHVNDSWASVEQVSWQWGWNDAIDAIINAAPTVDIVKCKDCKYYRTRWYGFCELIENENIHREDNDFCSWGERREDVRITDNN